MLYMAFAGMVRVFIAPFCMLRIINTLVYCLVAVLYLRHKHWLYLPTTLRWPLPNCFLRLYSLNLFPNSMPMSLLIHAGKKLHRLIYNRHWLSKDLHVHLIANLVVFLIAWLSHCLAQDLTMPYILHPPPPFRSKFSIYLAHI